MNKYESIIIINDSLENEQKNAFIEKIEKFIKENGKLDKTEIIGTRKLAYEIKKNIFGYYVVYDFYTKASTIAELERIYKISDEVLKFINMRMEE